jgi:hypothetical protein
MRMSEETETFYVEEKDTCAMYLPRFCETSGCGYCDHFKQKAKKLKLLIRIEKHLGDLFFGFYFKRFIPLNVYLVIIPCFPIHITLKKEIEKYNE